jgi:quinol monooxygenase YgiN
MTVVVVAYWTTVEASLPSVLSWVAALQPLSLAEPGCLGYEVLQSVDEPTSLVLIERYRDDAALEAHQSSAHYQEFVVGRIRPLLTDRQVEILRPRDGA